MNRLVQRKVQGLIRELIGRENWVLLSEQRRMALLEAIDHLMMYALEIQNGTRKSISATDIWEGVDSKLEIIERQELLVVLKGGADSTEFLDYGIRSYLPENIKFVRMRKEKMDQDILKLKNIKLDNEELEKRRLCIIESVENRNPIPADDLDLYIINMVVPGILEAKKIQEIEKWLEENSTMDIKPEQLHPEEDVGGPRGNEVW